MPPRVQHWGSITILSGLGGTLVASFIIWLVGQTMNIDPMLATMNRIEKSNADGHEKIAGIMQKVVDQLAHANTRITTVEILCEANRNNIGRCQDQVHKDK